jgi:hypothetical protein
MENIKLKDIIEEIIAAEGGGDDLMDAEADQKQ